MSQENVEAVRRGADAYNRGDIDALLGELDPEIEWHPLLQVLLGGEATVYRGHEGARELYRDLDEAFTEAQNELSEIRDLGERVVAIGHLRGRGAARSSSRMSPLRAQLGHQPDVHNWGREYSDLRTNTDSRDGLTRMLSEADPE
jgi:ketosteroid isomerase-like protein